MTHYKDIEQTIEIFRVKDKNGKYSWRAKKGWNSDKRDELVKPYKDNTAKSIGVVLDRYVVIDIDYKHDDKGADGYKTFKSYLNNNYSEDEIKQISDDIKGTMVVGTPKKGLHIWFELPEEIENNYKRKVNWIEGVDLLTNNKCFAPTPNTAREDGTYLIYNKSSENISIAPKWLIDILEENKRSKTQHNSEWRSKIETKNEHVNNNSIFYYYIETMKDGFEQGTRDDGIYKLACSVLNLAQKRVITLSSALFIVETTAKNCKPPFEDWETKWNSAMDYTNSKIK